MSASRTELERLLGPEAVSYDPEDLRAHAADLSPRSLLARRAGRASKGPAVVVRPSSTEAVSDVLAWAQASRTPVYPYGAGSGVCEGIAAGDGVALDTSRLDAIGDVDERSRLVRAQAGVRGPALVADLSARGMYLGHEPQSLDISTVGGWLATRSCGQLSAGYGGIEAFVAGIEMVLPGGGIARSRPSPRAALGPDVASLAIGSEGTLGVITEAVLRVSPEPSERAGAAVSFDHMADGVAACRSLAQGDTRPMLVRLYDREDAALAFRGLIAPPKLPVLLVAFNGSNPRGRLDQALASIGGRRAPDEWLDHWWERRNDIGTEYLRLMAGEGALGPHAILDSMEVAGTWSSLRDLYHRMKEALMQHAAFVGCHLSHVYRDGASLYFNLGSPASDDDEAARINEAWWETGMRVCLDSGGTISHHHGIGRLKARWLPEALGGWWDVLVAVKSAIDPHGIMNPGALGL